MSNDEVRVLRILAEYYKTRRIGGCGDVFYRGDAPFNEISADTWKELLDDRYIAEVYERYGLTGAGWRRALQVIGKLYDGETIDGLHKLCAKIIEARKDGRLEDPVSIDALADEDMPVEWISNVIESGLIEECLRQRGVSWADGTYQDIIVPSDFGRRL